MSCGPGAIKWIENVFNDCIITTRDKWSFAIGLISSVVFLVSSLPQIILNFKEKKVDGQSPFFFSLLFLASILNIIGVFITKGLITQIIQGIIYCILDGILFFQFIAYKYIMKTNDVQNDDQNLKSLHDSSNSSSSSESSDSDDSDDSDTTSNTDGHKHRDSQGNVDGIRTGGLATAALVGEVSAATNWAAPYKGDQIVGTMFGWVATVIYICSRVPQIMKNVKLQSVGDLSAFYFFLSIAGNFTYSFSVFLRNIESNYLWKQAPFLAGALGPLVCDVIVLSQMAYYGKPKAQGSTTDNDENDSERDGEARRINEL
ncbi:PQ loop repeat family protein [Tritrichomonas foetus]|uniref:PQ loop repeat family protein n=1 Tax=Tritrichomonas foetus TaxID=1144522 RepID=A0A1J4K322_9EUKA|nr:PQ loop repeat family protein [Tritrichomonas foetus]|eukprot:OHT04118.1 PQ loop repeat family protein [Tritrichomonas foetus]